MAGHPYFFPGRAQDISLVRKRRRRWRNVRPFDSRAPNIIVKRVAKINKFIYEIYLDSGEKQCTSYTYFVQLLLTSRI